MLNIAVTYVIKLIYLIHFRNFCMRKIKIHVWENIRYIVSKSINRIIAMKVKPAPSSKMNAKHSVHGHRVQQIPSQTSNESTSSQSHVNSSSKVFPSKILFTNNSSNCNLSSGHDLPPICE